MFKRVERKRKRREEEEELGLDEDTKDIMGLNETDSDESDSSSGSTQSEQESDPLAGRNDDENALSEEEGISVNPPISVEEALKDPIYAISLDPTVYGCVLCKGKLIKNAGATIAHKNSKVHKRRFEHFKLLSANADPGNNAWEVVGATQATSSVQASGSEETSKRVLKRQARQATVREKRKRHKELKARAIAKKALKKQLANGKTGTGASSEDDRLRDSPESLRKARKKQKLESKTTMGKTLDTTAKSPTRTKNSSDSKKSRIKGAKGANRSS